MQVMNRTNRLFHHSILYLPTFPTFSFIDSPIRYFFLPLIHTLTLTPHPLSLTHYLMHSTSHLVYQLPKHKSTDSPS